MALRDEQGHYESDFEYPLWKLIKQRAEEKDVSYSDAATEAVIEYGKGIRYRDMEYYNTEVEKRNNEMRELAQRAQSQQSS